MLFAANKFITATRGHLNTLKSMLQLHHMNTLEAHCYSADYCTELMDLIRPGHAHLAVQPEPLPPLVAVVAGGRWMGWLLQQDELAGCAGWPMHACNHWPVATRPQYSAEALGVLQPCGNTQSIHLSDSPVIVILNVITMPLEPRSELLPDLLPHCGVT